MLASWSWSALVAVATTVRSAVHDGRHQVGEALAGAGTGLHHEVGPAADGLGHRRGHGVLARSVAHRRGTGRPGQGGSGGEGGGRPPVAGDGLGRPDAHPGRGGAVACRVDVTPDRGSRHRSARIPAHVAVVMDGNGRWAQRRGLKRTDGHAGRRGSAVRHGRGRARARPQVAHGLRLLHRELEAAPATRSATSWGSTSRILVRRRDELHERGVRMRFIGRRDWRVPRRLIRQHGRGDRAHPRTTGDDLHDRLQLRRAGRDRRCRAGDGGGRRRRRQGRREDASAATSTTPRCPTPI